MTYTIEQEEVYCHAEPILEGIGDKEHWHPLGLVYIKAVRDALFEYAKVYGPWFYPKVPTIAKKAQISERSTSRALVVLQTWGDILPREKRKDRKGNWTSSMTKIAGKLGKRWMAWRDGQRRAAAYRTSTATIENSPSASQANKPNSIFISKTEDRKQLPEQPVAGPISSDSEPLSVRWARTNRRLNQDGRLRSSFGG